MNKKEQSEIKKAISKNNYLIHTIYSSYISSEKEKLFFKKVSTLNLGEESLSEYVKLFQKVLSGKIEKNFLNLEFKKEKDQEDIKHLKEIADYKVDDDEIEHFVNSFIEEYDNDLDYSIIIGFGKYDIPLKTKDDMMQDYSDSTYNFMIFAVCPIDMTKPSLQYMYSKKEFTNAKINQIVTAPTIGFIYPNFSRRKTNAYEVGYYAKKSNDQHEEIQEFLEIQTPLTAEDQKDRFKEIAEEAFGGAVDMKSIISINERTRNFIKEKQDEDETAKMDRVDLNHILSASGAKHEIEDAIEVMAENISDKNYTFQTEGIKVSVKGECINYISKQNINGKSCLIIPIDENTTLNGLSVK